MNNFTAFRADQGGKTMGSMMYVRNWYVPTILGIHEKEEDTVSSEFIKQTNPACTENAGMGSHWKNKNT